MHWQIYGKNEDGELDLEGGWQNNRPSKMHPRYRIVENVFEELLTTDRYFVYHSRPDDEATEIIDRWRHAYEVLKDTPWKTETAKVELEHEELLTKYLKVKPVGKQGKVGRPCRIGQLA